MPWTVRRRWIPHRDGIGLEARVLRRGRRHSTSDDDHRPRWIDVPLPPGRDEFVALVLVVLVVLALVFIGWPLVLLGIDLLWLVVVLIGGTIGRVVLHRPWRVEATSDGERREWFVQGFRAAGQLRDELANRFRHGTNPTPQGHPRLPD